MQKVTSISSSTSSIVVGKILCCLCGISIEPNAAAMCIDCLRTQYNITEDIEKSIELNQCKKCNRWHNRLDQWIGHDLESTGLMTLCLKKINTLAKKDIRVIDTAWVWTEPHSRRLKLSIDIERDVLDGKVKLRQRFIVEFIVIMKQCTDCAREETDHTWGALIQVRQNTGYKRSLYHLETLLTKSGYTDLLIDVEVKKEGLDLYFRNKSHAEKVADFISSNIPTKSKMSKKLISHNTHTNTAKQEFTICLDIATLVKDDLLLTTREMTGSIDIMLVTKISSSIHIINPFTLAKYELNVLKYFTLSPQPILTPKQLERFIVMDIEKINSVDLHAKSNDVWVLAEAEIVKESDFGQNDRSYRVITHLGNILQVGDLALGYDLSHSVTNEELIENLSFACPDIILVRKTYPEKSLKRKSRKLKRRNDKAAIQSTTTVELDVEEDVFVDNNQSSDDKEGRIEDHHNSYPDRHDHDNITSSTWLDVNDIEYELYQQQLYDEEELVAEIGNEFSSGDDNSEDDDKNQSKK